MCAPHSCIRATTSIGIEKAFIDESKQVFVGRSIGHRDRGLACRCCGKHVRAGPLTRTESGLPFLHRLASAQNPAQRELASLARADAWLNSPALTAADLRGKVVLIDFWTYTCINWLRTLPYVRAWADKYRDQGLVVIGVHAPEFAFEKDISNVRWAVKDMRSITRSRSTMTMSYGAHSGTSIGQRSILSMRMDVFGIIILARVRTNNRR